MADVFHDRATLGEAFANAVFDFLKSAELLKFVVRAGVELSQLAPFLRQLQTQHDPMSNRLRFNPDGAMLIPVVGMAHWEAKASRAIERAPYEWYLRHEARGEPVYLIISPDLLDRPNVDRHVFIGRVRDIVLADGDESVSEYPSELRYPTLDGWIVPRESARGSQRGSGTPFRYINVPASRMLRIGIARRTTDDTVLIHPDLLINDSIERVASAVPSDNYARVARQFFEEFRRLIIFEQPNEERLTEFVDDLCGRVRAFARAWSPRQS